MTFTICKYCGRRMLSTASTCTGCGHPMTKPVPVTRLVLLLCLLVLSAAMYQLYG